MNAPADPYASVRALQEALRFHRSGNLDQAEALYRTILAQNGRDFNALHLLGQCRQQRGDLTGAMACLTAALEAAPNVAQGHLSLGNALRELQRLPEAIERYARAVALDPGMAIAHYNLGTALEEAGRYNEAIESYDRALGRSPGAAAWCGRGSALAVLGRPEEALTALRAAAQLDPGHADAHANLGAVLMQLKRFDEALAPIERALALQPGHPDASRNLPMLLNELRRPADALAASERALAAAESDADQQFERAHELTVMRRFDEAMPLLQGILERDPAHWPARFDLASILISGGRTDRASEAFAHLEILSAARPKDARTLFNRGLLHYNLGEFAAARRDMKSAGDRGGHPPLGKYKLGMLDLLEGDFANGWKGNECRWDEPALRLERRIFAEPQWQGEPDIAHQVLLVHADQGQGDSVQFCRYVSLLAREFDASSAWRWPRAGKVVFEVQPPLFALMRRWMPRAVEVIAHGAPLPRFDRHVPLLSLPMAMGTTLANVPSAPHGLSAEPARVEVWRHRLGRTGMRRVGLAWSGSPGHANDRQRSVALEQLAPVLKLAQGSGGGAVEFVALQNTARDGDRAALARYAQIRYFGAALEDFEDTAALVALCELVVCVDTAAAHLAATMGTPTWILLPFVPEWRWMLEREDNPWYPSARLFRQPRLGDWDSVAQRTAAALGQFLQMNTPPDGPVCRSQ